MLRLAGPIESNSHLRLASGNFAGMDRKPKHSLRLCGKNWMSWKASYLSRFPTDTEKARDLPVTGLGHMRPMVFLQPAFGLSFAWSGRPKQNPGRQGEKRGIPQFQQVGTGEAFATR